MTIPLGELASQVRSKNAGPFWMTIDIFLPDDESYSRATGSSVTDVHVIGDIYDVAHESVRIFRIPDLHAIKISVPRPAVQGSLRDRDMHAGQQFVPLLDLPVA